MVKGGSYGTNLREVAVDGGGGGVGAAVGGDGGEGGRASVPGLWDAGGVGGGVLGAHQGPPQLLGRRADGQPGPGRTGGGRRFAGGQLQRRQQAGRVGDLGADRVDEGG